MGDLFNNLVLGFSVAFTPANLLACLVGCLGGTLVGVLPGIGPVTTIALMLPVTFYLPPESGLIMLAGIFYGAQYGGSTTAILVNIPGETSSVVTAIDGYQMAQKGRAGPALSVAALASVFAGTIATILICIAAPPLAVIGKSFGAPEYCALMLLGLVGSVVIASGSVLKAFAMVLLGLTLGIVGIDVNSGDARFTFGITSLMDGIDFVPISVGLFGLGEVISNLRGVEYRMVTEKKLRLWPSGDDFRKAAPAALRGTAVGSVIGLLPGGGAALSAFMAYVLEKKVAKDPSIFGKGAVQGVAGPEAANNAGAQTSFIPMLTLGIPGNAVMAVMVAALMIHGIAPGPGVMTDRPQLFWGLIASMFIGNVMLVVINLPLIGIWIRLLQVPFRLLYLAIIAFCAIGSYAFRGNPTDVMIATMFGVLGYFFIKYKCEAPPLLLGFVLGPQMEENLRRSMLISGGDFKIFAERPISLGLLIVTAIMIMLIVLPSIRKTREEAFQED
jgi:putative tricarboxylic transport membrane protein